MRTPRPEIVEHLREGFVGTIHVNWDNGCGLGVAYGEDACRRIDHD